MKMNFLTGLGLLSLAVTTPLAAQAQSGRNVIGVNVCVREDISRGMLADLGKLGKVRDVVYSIRALTMQVRADQLDLVRARPYVESANPDAARNGAPVDGLPADNLADGNSTWGLDIINVTDTATGTRTVAQDGTGVYVAVLDTGLLDSWRIYFPQERIATEFAACFGGGGGEVGTVSTQPMKWEHDQNSHGSHVTSTILGFNMPGSRKINGVAPMAKVIPVKVLNQNGSGWSSVIARGITYVADLKAGPLANSPVVINMSLGGPALDAMEKAAIDYAISKGVIVVASAGNSGEQGMGYPGAYAPVISVAAAGWTGEWSAPGSWWRTLDVPEPTTTSDLYITDFSSRAKPGQELDVAAPGSWIVGPYQENSGQISFFFLGGTSMASPHVAGVVALMAQKNPALTASQAESLLKQTAIPMPAGCRNILLGPGLPGQVCWEADATGAGFINAKAVLDAMP